MKEKLVKIWTKIKNSKVLKKVSTNAVIILIIILVTIIATLEYVRTKDKSDVPVISPDTSQAEEIMASNPSVNLEYMSAFLAKTSELTTGTLKTKGYLDYTAEKGIPWLTQEAFGMIYEANIRAGIHLEQVKIHGKDDNNRTIYITLPNAEILDASVNPKEIRYIDEKFTLFPANEKEHANKAQAVAEEDAIKYGKTTGILKFADEHAKTLFIDLCESMIFDYTVEFVDENFDISSVNIEETKNTETAETDNDPKAE